MGTERERVPLHDRSGRSNRGATRSRQGDLSRARAARGPCRTEEGESLRPGSHRSLGGSSSDRKASRSESRTTLHCPIKGTERSGRELSLGSVKL